jgi:hypothetical protein
MGIEMTRHLDEVVEDGLPAEIHWVCKRCSIWHSSAPIGRRCDDKAPSESQSDRERCFSEGIELCGSKWAFWLPINADRISSSSWTQFREWMALMNALWNLWIRIVYYIIYYHQWMSAGILIGMESVHSGVVSESLSSMDAESHLL